MNEAVHTCIIPTSLLSSVNGVFLVLMGAKSDASVDDDVTESEVPDQAEEEEAEALDDDDFSEADSAVDSEASSSSIDFSFPSSELVL